jgi:hypothetical protein
VPFAARVSGVLAGHVRVFPAATEQEYAVSVQSDAACPEQLDVRFDPAPTVELLTEVGE